MKNSIISIIITSLAIIYASGLKASNKGKIKDDTLSCLQIEGQILNADEGADGMCIIELIDNDGLTDSIILKEGRTKFKYVLHKNSYYALRISKVGYISKLISVNTELLTQTDEMFKFKFETSLIQEAALKRLNHDALDFPVAIIHYDYENECFSYNKEYTDNIKKQLHNVSASASK
jgi:hypothetical protein